MFYVLSFLGGATLTYVRAPNVWYLKTAFKFKFVLELFVHITLGQLTCRLLRKWKSRCLRHLHSAEQNERKCKENEKKRQVTEETRMCWHVFLTCCREVFCIVVWGSLLSFPAPWKWSDTPPAGFFTDEPKLKLRSSDSANSRTLKN